MLVPLALLLAAAPTARQSLHLAGRVLGPGGQAAPGARVFAASPGEFPSTQARLEARSACDAQGRFELEVPDEWIARGGYKELSLFAWAEGAGLACRAFESAELPVGTSIELALPPAAQASLELLDPEGRPVAGVRVEPTELRRAGGTSAIPAELAALLGAVGDAQGRVVLDAQGLANLTGLRLCDPAGVTRLVRETPRSARGWSGGRLQLAALGRVRIQASVEVGSFPPPTRLRSRSFLVPTAQLPVGELAVSGLLERDQPLLLDALAPSAPQLEIECAPEQVLRPLLDGVRVQAGTEQPARLRWTPGMRVRGRIVERGTGVPVAGARLRWRQLPVAEVELVSGADGRFEVRALAGDVFSYGLRAPAPYLSIVDPSRLHWKLPADTESFELPDLELVRGIALEGQVQTAQGEPAAGAWIDARSPDLHEAEPFRANALADAEGRFRIECVEPGTLLELRARLGPQSMGAALQVEVRAGASVLLQLGLPAGSGPAGQVLDERGTPVAGAEVEVWEMSFPNVGSFQRQVGSTLRTDEQGRFASPEPHDAAKAYFLRVHADGHALALADAGSADQGEQRVTLARLARVEGRILDEHGEPLSGAELFVRDAPIEVRARSDAQGRFVLDGVEPRTILLQLRSPGPARGLLVDARQGSCTWTLAPAATRETGSPRSAAPAVAHERELALVEPLVRARLQTALDAKNPNGICNGLCDLARIDPGAALAHCEQGVLEPYLADIVRSRVAEALRATSTEEAALVVHLVQGSFARSHGLLDLAASLAPGQRARALDLVGEALVEGQAAESPEYRLGLVAKAARTLQQLGEPARARKLLLENAARVGELPREEWSGYVRTLYAEALAPIDLERALAIVAESPERSERERHYTNIAQRIAGSDPAGSERALELAKQSQGFGSALRRIPALCHAMAAVDCERARRLALEGGPSPDLYALGMMALALAERDRPRALELLEETYARIEALSRAAERSEAELEPATLGALLLPVVEALVPDRLPEFLWRSTALRRLRAGAATEWDEGRALAADAALALLVARYDRGLARALLEPVVESLAHERDLGGDWKRVVPAALALTDPEWALEFVRPPRSERARGMVSNVLSRDGTERWNYALEQCLYVWFVGKEDL